MRDEVYDEPDAAYILVIYATWRLMHNPAATSSRPIMQRDGTTKAEVNIIIAGVELRRAGVTTDLLDVFETTQLMEHLRLNRMVRALTACTNPHQLIRDGIVDIQSKSPSMD